MKPLEPLPGTRDARFELLIRVLLRKSWNADQYLDAMSGFFMREHSEEAHPAEVERVAELSTASLDAVKKEAWLFGYRFRDTPAPGGDDGDGHAGSI